MTATTAGLASSDLVPNGPAQPVGRVQAPSGKSSTKPAPKNADDSQNKKRRKKAKAMTQEFLRDYLALIVQDDSFAMPNGSFPIRNKKELQAAIRLNGKSTTYKRSEVRAHIKSRAAALGLSSLIPDSWSQSTQEAAGELPPLTQQEKTLTSCLVLEKIAAPVIIQEASSSRPGVMRIRAPFYIGGSVSNAPNFDKKIIWQEAALPKVIQRAKAKIAAAQQPITSYARHAHALAGDDLPIATVVDVEQEGNIGYATLDVYPVEPRGTHVQTLVQARALNAMSLRTRDFELRDGLLNGEPCLLCEDLDLQGLDFAPDGPAQPTYGIQLLTQEAVIEAVTKEASESPENSKESKKTLSKEQPQEITLERVRAEAPDVVTAIEAPLRDRIKTLETENKALVQEKNLRLRDAAIERYARDCSEKPEEFAKALTELCQEQGIDTEAGVNTVVAPLLLQELRKRQTPPSAPAAKSPQDRLLELFGTGPSATTSATGQTVVQEAPPAAPVAQAATRTEEIVQEETMHGMVLPEGF